jgi:hypothetical protein
LSRLPYDALLNVSALINTVPAPSAGSVVVDAGASAGAGVSSVA